MIYFVKEKKYSQARIAVEKALIINELNRRFDILIYDKNAEPYLLVECKAPEVKISQTTFEQIAQYNLELKVPYLLVTNGITTYCCKMDYENQSYEFLEKIPDKIS